MEINYEELEEVGFFDYVSKHYWEMSNEQLTHFLKELSYAAEQYCILIHGIAKGKLNYKMHIEGDAIEQLKDMDI